MTERTDLVAWTISYECRGQSIGGNHLSHTSLKHSLYCLVIWWLRTCYRLYQKKAGLSPRLDQIFFSPFLNILYNHQISVAGPQTREICENEFPLQSKWTAASCHHRGRGSAPPSDDLTCLNTFLKAASGLFLSLNISMTVSRHRLSSPHRGQPTISRVRRLHVDAGTGPAEAAATGQEPANQCSDRYSCWEYQWMWIQEINHEITVHTRKENNKTQTD